LFGDRLGTEYNSFSMKWKIMNLIKNWKFNPLVILFISIFLVVGITTTAIQSTAKEIGNTQLLWYGQAAFKLTTPQGQVLLIDPWVENPANPNSKSDLADLDKVDLILITHGHFDHVGNAVQIAKKTQAKLVTTFDLGKALVSYGGYPQELVTMENQGNFGGELSLLNNEVKIAFIPAVHSSTVASDGSPQPYYAGNPGGFLISVKNGPVIYHTGDTDVFNDMSLIREFRPVDMMLACIGGKFTMGPDRAAVAVKLVKPKTIIPMHYGTFNLPGNPKDLQTELKRKNLNTKMMVMKVGQTIKI
jgi:L-ascorbate metabolism protein UlaG (beta-lactamase superfamily)